MQWTCAATVSSECVGLVYVDIMHKAAVVVISNVFEVQNFHYFPLLID